MRMRSAPRDIRVGGDTVLGVAGAWPTWKDPRVKAVVAMSPHVSPFTYNRSLGALNVPIMYQGSQLDAGETPMLEGPNGAYAQTDRPKYFAKLRGGAHFVWTNTVCRDVTTIAQCLAKANPSLVDAYGIAFFDRYLKCESTPLLGGNGAGLSHYQFVP